MLRCGSCGDAMVPRTDTRGYTFYCCSGHITLGDGQDYFKSTLDQVGSLNSQAGSAPSDKQP